MQGLADSMIKNRAGGAARIKWLVISSAFSFEAGWETHSLHEEQCLIWGRFFWLVDRLLFHWFLGLVFRLFFRLFLGLVFRLVVGLLVGLLVGLWLTFLLLWLVGWVFRKHSLLLLFHFCFVFILQNLCLHQSLDHCWLLVDATLQTYNHTHLTLELISNRFKCHSLDFLTHAQFSIVRWTVQVCQIGCVALIQLSTDATIKPTIFIGFLQCLLFSLFARYC